MEQHENARGGEALQIALFGADALLAARPATPVQFIHACLAVGYDAAYPVSWGDELVAQACLNALRRREAGPVALCACPHTSAAAERRDPETKLVLAPPPVATARVVRAAYPDRDVRVTFIGTCPGGEDPSVDAQLFPTEFVDALARRGVSISGQPETFDAMLPPDRRRFLSLPGGAPAIEHLEAIGWTLVHEPALAAQHRRVLIDEAPHLGCACAASPEGRLALAELEPPRATSPIFDPNLDIDMTFTPRWPTPPARPATPAPAAPMHQQHSAESGAEAARDIHVAPPDEGALVDREVPVEAAGVEAAAVPEVVELADAPPDTAGVTILGAPGARPEIRSGEPGAAPFRPILAIPEAAYREARRVPGWGDGVDGIEVRPQRRIAAKHVLVGLLFAATVSLAAFGGWALARGGWLPFASRPSASKPTAMPELPGAIATTPDSTIEPPADSAAALGADSVGASDSLAMVAGAADTSVRTAATEVPHVKQAGTTPATRPRDRAPATTPRAANAARPVAVRRSAPPRLEPGKPVVQPATDSAAVSSRDSAELRMLREEIARRRARLDSLSRVVDSLRRTSPKPR